MTPSIRRSRPVLLLTLFVLLFAAVAAPVSAKQKPPKGPDDNAVFFASDGMRQDLVAKYAGQGVMPTMKRVPQEGHVRGERRPPDPGAAQHGRRLVQPGDRRVAGRPRLHQQHVLHRRPGVHHGPDGGVRSRTSSRSRRSPSPPSAAA